MSLASLPREAKVGKCRPAPDQIGIVMSILSWVLVGLAVGLLAGLIREGDGPVGDAIVAVVGAIIGGWLYAMLFGASVTHFSATGTITALVASVIFLAGARALTSGRSTI
jgi:uncharacterized membrane protein YeaQ/YmgE (transglycosylase-associated protein family)